MQNDPEMSEEKFQDWKAAEITGWDAEFVNVELQTLFDMILVRKKKSIKKHQ